MTTRLRSRLGALAAAGIVAFAGLPMTATDAQAVGGNCSASKQSRSVRGPDLHRARAKCTSLKGDTRARARLNRSGGPDYYSSWFTTRNKYYYTSWYTCYAGCSAQVDLGRV